jgi:hypothetical protein
MGSRIGRILVQAFVAPSILLATPGVAEAKQSTTINQKENVEIYTSVGDLLVKVTLKEGLPNALGGSDIFGRKRERGFVELRFMGMAPDGRAVFRRKSVDIVSNETTLSPSQSLSGGQASVVQRGSGTNIAIIGSRGGDATVETLPADTIEFALDLSKHRIITIEDRVIELIQADPGGVSFKLSRRTN